MKNNGETMNLTQLAANGDILDFAIAEAQGKIKVTRLATKNAPRQGVANRNHRAVTNEVNFVGVAVGKGGNGNLKPVGGIGREMVTNLSQVNANFERQIAKDRKAAARERAAEREAYAVAELDALLEDVRG
jgi:hypothetical protein